MRRRSSRLLLLLGATSMALAMLLRVLSALPVISTPHQHGTLTHIHGAGGLVHDHDDRDANKTAVAFLRVVHVHHDEDVPHHHHPDPPVSNGPKHRQRATPDEEEHHPDQPVPDESPAGHYDDYYCAAATAALAQATTPATRFPQPIEAAIPDYGGTIARGRTEPGQSRAPPHPSLPTHT